jgi:hypothetical protein
MWRSTTQFTVPIFGESVMSNARFYPLTALLAVALLAVSGLYFGDAFAQDKGKGKDATPKWEFKVIRVGAIQATVNAEKIEESLNTLGKDGWECVSTLSDVRGVAKSQTWTEAVLIFKRSKK